MYYYASRTPDLKILSLGMAGCTTPALYLSSRRENVLADLSNAIEKYCLETGYAYSADWSTWKPQGFDKDGVFCLEEYYPNAICDTYKGVSGYIYQVDAVPNDCGQEKTPDGIRITDSRPLPVCDCEYIPDAYEAILAAAQDGAIRLLRFEDMNENTKKIITSLVKGDYDNAADIPAYRSFLEEKFQCAQKGKD